MLIALLTDFGTRDYYVGAMKGVILGINPRATIVDITHEIGPQNIQSAAFVLRACYRDFPVGTIFLCVVDPGVGSKRRGIIVGSKDHYFVGPDNGVLSLALAREKIQAVHQITNEQLFLRPLSNTFHGRDVFAPVAAKLSNGLALGKVGATIKKFVKLNWPEARRTADSMKGEIVYIDRFGNAITNMRNGRFTSMGKSSCEIFLKDKRLCSLQEFYQAVAHGAPVAVRGSSGFLELAANGDSAAKKFKLKVGQAVIARFRPH